MLVAASTVEVKEHRVTTTYYHHDIFVEHLTPPGHPERPERLRAITEALAGDAFDALDRQQAPLGDEATLLYAHPEEHIAALEAAIPEEGIARVDPETSASPKSWESVLHAVGAANAAVDVVFSGTSDNAFVAARPPGHHAEKTRSMGFCLVNNAAIAARHAQKAHGAERIAIIDWDVHHGNGTQDIFYEDQSVLYASTHQMPLYPGSGALSEEGVGNIFNAPLSPDSGGETFRDAFKQRILPAVEDFQPDLIIISAGFDAHYRDPLAQINLVEEDFDWATGRIMDLANRYCDNRLVSLLEGGYDLTGLADSTSAHGKRLMNG